MPHENPFMAPSSSGIIKPKTNFEASLSENINKEQRRMPVVEKVKNVRSVTDTSGSKVPIPEHIHDANAKTFYKLGQFLGKV